MEAENYQVDKLAIVQEQESRAAEKISEIEDRCNVHAISFIKSNYGYPKLRNRQTEPEIKFLIGAALLKSAMHLGIKDIDDIHKPDIMNALFSHYSDLTLEEIYKAFELERFNVYEEKTEHYQLFNSEFVTAILKKYRAYKHKIRTEHNILPGKDSKKELTPEEKEQLVVDGVNRAYDEFKETGTIEGLTEYIFDFLVEKSKIKTKGSPALVEYYEDKLTQAKEQLKKETEKAEPKSRTEKNQINVDLEKIIAGTSGKILIRAKRNILLEFFKKQNELKQQTIF